MKLPYFIDAVIKEKCIEMHKNTNHFYDKYLPYEFHLRMVEQVHQDFFHLLPKLFTDDISDKDYTQSIISAACWGHDLIEDTRCSYNDVVSIMGMYAADIVYACTNEKGKNRAERANDKYYEGIRNTPGAVFVKLCDRIANIQYSKMSKSRMFNMYERENKDFFKRMGYHASHELKPMFEYLLNLF